MNTGNDIVIFKGKNISITEGQYNTFVASISSQNPTRDEVDLHLWYCDSKGVNPLDKLIYFTKRKGRYVPVTSIDFMRARAESSGAYVGSDDAVFETENGRTENGRIVSATVTVSKIVQGVIGKFTATARWAEYAPQDLNDSSAFLWKKMPHTMLAKCAEALALRKAFPGQLHGLYAAEEMAQDGRYTDNAVNTIEAVATAIKPSRHEALIERYNSLIAHAESLGVDIAPYELTDGMTDDEITKLGIELKSIVDDTAKVDAEDSDNQDN